MRFAKWRIGDSLQAPEIARQYGVGSLAAKAAAARSADISPEMLFSTEDGISSPFDYYDMARAVEAIEAALDAQQRIVVYGDYDVDGITATVILYSYLQALGADVDFYIPNRETEGYGLNARAIEEIGRQGCALLITVDNGIAAVEEVALAQSLGMTVVVTDHHQPPEILPDCIAVDPHRPDCSSRFKELCGAAVAFKLVAALEGGDYEGAFEQYAELLALATIADVVPLVGENRTLVRLGLLRMRETDNLGLHALIEASLSPQAKLDSVSVAYSLVPRLNAAGRMGSALRAVELLLCEDDTRAQELAEELCRANASRRESETAVLEEIDRLFLDQPQLFDDRVIVLCADGWHPGVLGIVAAKVVERTGKPALLLSKNGETASGSGRSVEGFPLLEALRACSAQLTRFGGHSLAAGLCLQATQVDAFRRAINAYARQHFPFMPEAIVSADAVIEAQEVTLAAVRELSVLEPFGRQNPEPAFVFREMMLKAVSTIGSGKHSRLSVSDGNAVFTAVCFGKTAEEFEPFVGNKVDLLVRLKINVYQQTESVTVQVLSLRPSGLRDEVFFKERQLASAAAQGEVLTAKSAAYLYPTREQAAAVYRLLRRQSAKTDADTLWWQLGGSINRAKLGAVLEAFCQCGLLQRQGNGFSVCSVGGKTDLFQCGVLLHIKQAM